MQPPLAALAHFQRPDGLCKGRGVGAGPPRRCAEGLPHHAVQRRPLPDQVRVVEAVAFQSEIAIAIAAVIVIVIVIVIIIIVLARAPRPFASVADIFAATATAALGPRAACS